MDRRLDFNIFLALLALLFIGLALRYSPQFLLGLPYVWKPLSTQETLVLALIRIGLVISAVSLLVFRKRMYVYRREFLLVLGAALAGFLLMEGGARLYLCTVAPPQHQQFLLLEQCGVRSMPFQPHHYLNFENIRNYEGPDGQNRHNSMGFRGPEIRTPKPNGTVRIVTLGGSTTYTFGVQDWREDFARELQKRLRARYNYSGIEVVNAGTNAYMSAESLITLQFKVLDLDPDMIIIYHGVNDVAARLVAPAKYRGDNSGRRRSWRPPALPLPFRSVLVRWITGVIITAQDYYRAPTTDPVPPVSTHRINGSPADVLEQNPPIYFRRNLRNMIAIAHEHDVKVLLATWAYPASAPFRNRTGSPAAHAFYRDGIRENNAVVTSVASQKGVPLYDFAEDMPDDPRYWADGMHVNEEGADIKAELFAEYLSSHRLLDQEVSRAKRQ